MSADDLAKYFTEQPSLREFLKLSVYEKAGEFAATITTSRTFRGCENGEEIASALDGSKEEAIRAAVEQAKELLGKTTVKMEAIEGTFYRKARNAFLNLKGPTLRNSYDLSAYLLAGPEISKYASQKYKYVARVTATNNSGETKLVVSGYGEDENEAAKNAVEEIEKIGAAKEKTKDGFQELIKYIRDVQLSLGRDTSK